MAPVHLPVRVRVRVPRRRPTVPGWLGLPACWFLVCCLAACGDTDQRFADPAATFATYRDAVSAGDAELAWACLSASYRAGELGDDLAAWQQTLAGDAGRRLARDLARREITGEQQINDRVGYLQFDESTVPTREGPFFYFLREADGWKITSHTDSLFRTELEGAIERGELILPR